MWSDRTGTAVITSSFLGSQHSIICIGRSRISTRGSQACVFTSGHIGHDAAPTRRRRCNCDCRSLEGEINAGADHSEVVVPAINNVPAEITEPANVWREANFQAGAQLANRLGRGTQMIGCGNGENEIASGHVPAFSLTAAKDCAAARPNIWRKARTMDRVTQCERAQNRADCTALVPSTKLEDFHSRNVFEFASGIDYPSFNSDAEIPAEEILCIDAPAPCVV